MSNPPGPLAVCAENPRYFATPDGRAVLLTGSHTWATLQDMWLEGTQRRDMDYPGLLTMMADYGHNFLRFWSWMHTRNADWSETPTLFDPQPYARTGPGTANDGGPKFDLTRWNDAYFERLRERVIAAGERGIYVGVMLFEAWTVKWPRPHTDSWPHHPMHPDNNVNGVTDDPVLKDGRGEGKAWDLFSLHCPQLLGWQEAYARKVVDTLNDLDHVVWEICNEIPHRKEAMDWSEHIVSVIREYERGKPKQHPIGITSEGGEQNNAELFACNADWISPSNGRLFEYRYDPPATDGTKVVLSDTDHLWGHGGEVAWVWKSFCRGMNVLFMDPWEPIPGDMDWWFKEGVPLNRRYYPAWDPLRRNLGYLQRYAARVDLNRAVPADALCTTRYCLADAGNTYLCFLPEGGHAGLNLWDAPGQYDAEWFDPNSERTVKAGTVKGNARHALSAPFPGPSVLFLSRQPDAA
jgi:hypothetical protein